MNIKNLFDKLVSDNWMASQKKYWDAVSNQGKVHNRRMDGAQVDLIRTARPDEDVSITNYRMANFRNITYPSVSKHKTKVKRILNFDVNKSEILKNENFDALRFSEDILDDIYENPNVGYFVFPYVENDPLRKPSELRQSEKPKIELKRLDSENTIYIDKDLVAFRYEKIKINKSEYTTYILADSENVYIAIPQTIDKKIVYVLEIWYAKIVEKVEFIKQSPIALLPGVASKTNKNEYYQETYFKGAYEYYNEALATFSDSQAVSWRYNYPKPVMAEIDCIAEGCQDGWIYLKDHLGNAIKENGLPKKNKCGVCNGHGKITDPTVFKTLTYPQGSLTQPNQSSRPILEYVTPDVGIIQSSFERPFVLLEKGDKAIGLDLLEDAGANNSDQSLERRMEDLLDMISAIGNGLYDALDNIMYNIELIRSPFAKELNPSVVVRPSTFNIKTTGDIFKESQESYFEDRFVAKMNYYRAKYKNDDRLIRIYELILYCDPVSLMNLEEIANYQALGLIKDYDNIRHMNIYAAVEQAYDKDNDITIAQCQAEIKKYLIELGLYVEPVATADVAVENKLLQTVGSVSSIVEISRAVSEGAMTEEAAENLLVTIFKIDRDIAKSLIQIPETTPNQVQTPIINLPNGDDNNED